MSRADLDKFMSQADVDQLKAYVSAPGKAGGAAQGDSTVLLAVSHSNLKAQFMEIRFDRHMTIRRVKERLQSHTGTSPDQMTLQLKDWDNKVLCVLEDQQKLGYYSPEDGFLLHVVDHDEFSMSKGGWLEDTSLVEKYQISDEDYYKRDNNYRKWKEGKLAEDPEWCLEKEMAKKRGVEYVKKENVSDPEYMAEDAANISIGQRCEVQPGGKRGEVKFVGKAGEGLPMGWWIGVQYDEPVGKNDGSVKGVRYFECMEGYGGMIRPDKVTVGDFPEIDEFASDEDEI
mmetsp:Transcript_23811/g.28735  ORF Transcript_23811/g.28735 Transcript_23811/m.28735 type:complete len:286 (-) Transcript_23811:115-972(-)|eukprot:CAMPEP_0197848048 /NCGR_PEP_ID=MMETSP1438-20131217/7895_1 /TAXON_ID=1461541 /ORGANISM="Pterosperma sp., Strain CCMP1384" /LENGTH=285 /DNA_ID=CAMNT_0043460175 /DNA_START=161 /DNA_END=1018 /DNA_ORIENTATION=+